jgi:hypothetical protein
LRESSLPLAPASRRASDSRPTHLGRPLVTARERHGGCGEYWADFSDRHRRVNPGEPKLLGSRYLSFAWAFRRSAQ